MQDSDTDGPVELARGGRGAVELDRIAFFSDAVMAIAITLVAVDLAVPAGPVAGLGGSLRDLLPELGAFY